MNKQKIIASFSGGKDSTWMILEMIRRNERIDVVVFFDTGWEFPQMYEHVEKVKNIVENAGIEFLTLHPDKPFDYYMFEKPIKNGEKYGYSWCGARGCRWGTQIKTSTIDKYFKNEQDHIQCVGIAYDEKDRIGKEWQTNKRYPLVEWEITEKECLEGCYKKGFDWGGLYEDLDRVSCKFCAMKNLKELRNIYFKMPDVWKQLKEYQDKTRMSYRPNASIHELEIRFKLEEKFINEGKSISNKIFFKALKEEIESYINNEEHEEEYKQFTIFDDEIVEG